MKRLHFASFVTSPIPLLFLFHSYSTASDGSDESSAGHVVSPCSTMISEVKRRSEQECKKYRLHRINITLFTVGCLMYVDASRKLNQVFLLVDSFKFNFVDEERSDIYPE